uniref:Sodium channel protein Nach n=1 Tax=Vespula pensylvanica TaxID=30213 RepID=A0A834U5G6_VESPE|nr:hypothetical protein H0235_011728 [Vespula pensylvanica]
MKTDVTEGKVQIKARTSKVGASNAWASSITKRSSLRYHIFKTFVKYVSLYCEQSTLVGYKYLTEPRRTWIESHSNLQYQQDKSTIRDENGYESVREIFIVLNKHEMMTVMHGRTGWEWREGVGSGLRSNVTKLSSDEILELIEQLGDAYNSMHRFEITRYDELNRVLLDFYEGDYDMDAIMKELTPQCTLMLIKCLFNGNEYNCSELFSFEKTQDGYCCTFNYIIKGNTNNDEEPMEVRTVKDLGIERGLTVVMEPFLDDYFYTFLPVIGWKVTLFNPTDYPDNISGGVTEVLVSPLLESYLEIEAVSFYSTGQTKSYPISKRKCIFPNEIRTRYGDYSYSDCLVDCREQLIWKMCKCIPFYLPTRTEVNSKYGRRACTLTDMPCLNHYKSEWLTVFPHEEETLNITMNNYKSLHCKSCYPSCQDVVYTMHSSFSTMQPGFYETSLLNNFNIVDQSIIHVFFSKYGTVRLKQDISYTWYELLSDIGGICGVFIGFSLISVVELIYFFVLLLFDLYKSYDPNSEEIDIEIPRKEATMYTIYWNELVPKTRIEKDLLRHRKVERY